MIAPGGPVSGADEAEAGDGFQTDRASYSTHRRAHGRFANHCGPSSARTRGNRPCCRRPRRCRPPWRGSQQNAFVHRGQRGDPRCWHVGSNSRGAGRYKPAHQRVQVWWRQPDRNHGRGERSDRTPGRCRSRDRHRSRGRGEDLPPLRASHLIAQSVDRGSAYTLLTRSSRHTAGRFGSKASPGPGRRSPSIFPREPPPAKKELHAERDVDPTLT